MTNQTIWLVKALLIKETSQTITEPIDFQMKLNIKKLSKNFNKKKFSKNINNKIFMKT